MPLHLTESFACLHHRTRLPVSKGGKRGRNLSSHKRSAKAPSSRLQSGPRLVKAGLMMTRWSRVNDLFHAALARADADRDVFLAAECGSDAALRNDVKSLLAAHDANAVSTSRSLMAVGTHVAGYEITGFVAAGAMGEVYRARDTKLGRDVALKILPAAFIPDSDRRARFQRGATAGLAQSPEHCDHLRPRRSRWRPCTCAGTDRRRDARRTDCRGRIPIEDALRIAKQMAEALEAAHEQGIIHRDLNPPTSSSTRWDRKGPRLRVGQGARTDVGGRYRRNRIAKHHLARGDDRRRDAARYSPLT